MNTKEHAPYPIVPSLLAVLIVVGLMAGILVYACLNKAQTIPIFEPPAQMTRNESAEIAAVLKRNQSETNIICLWMNWYYIGDIANAPTAIGDFIRLETNDVHQTVDVFPLREMKYYQEEGGRTLQIAFDDAGISNGTLIKVSDRRHQYDSQ